MDKSTQEMSLVQVAQRLPWLWRCWMYLLTVILFLGMMLIFLLAALPMWLVGFKRVSGRMIERTTEWAHQSREYFMRPAFRKYLLFDRLAGKI
jgi:predicted alpha/beta hydrolase